MEITMTRYKREELELAVEEKLAKGYVCISPGIVEVGSERKLWSHGNGSRSKYCGRETHKKFMVKMKAPDKMKKTA